MIKEVNIDKIKVYDIVYKSIYKEPWMKQTLGKLFVLKSG